MATASQQRVTPDAMRLGYRLRNAELYATALPGGAYMFRLDWRGVAAAWGNDLLRRPPAMPQKAFLIPEWLSWDQIEERVWVLPPKRWQRQLSQTPVAHSIDWMMECGMIVDGEPTTVGELCVTTRDGYFVASLPPDDEGGLYDQLVRHLGLL